MGRGGFEPPKCKHNRFTVCPFWPLRNLPVIKFKYQKSKVKMIMQNVKIFLILVCGFDFCILLFDFLKSPGKESNLRPEVYKTPALPAELPGRYSLLIAKLLYRLWQIFYYVRSNQTGFGFFFCS